MNSCKRPGLRFGRYLCIGVVFLAVAVASDRALAQQETVDVLRRTLEALSGAATQPPAAPRQGASNPGLLSRGSAAMRYSNCAQLNSQGLATALAAAPMSDQARQLMFRAGSPESVVKYCADQLHHHLCTGEMLRLTGNFLTSGNRAIDAVPQAAQDAGTANANPLALGLGVVGAVVGPAITGRPVAGTVGGAAVGYGAGSMATDAGKASLCERRRASMHAVSSHFRRGYSVNSPSDVDMFLNNNAGFVPAQERSALQYMHELSQQMRSRAPQLQQLLQ